MKLFEDATGEPISLLDLNESAESASEPEETITLTIQRKEFEDLSAKTRMVLAESRLAEERITKHQEEIDKLKLETRQILERLRAA